MQLTYDPRRNVAYLRFRDAEGVQVETIRLSDEINIDLAPDGSVYGVDLLNANEQLRGRDGQLVLDLAGQRIEVPLPAARPRNERPCDRHGVLQPKRETDNVGYGELLSRKCCKICNTRKAGLFASRGCQPLARTNKLGAGEGALLAPTLTKAGSKIRSSPAIWAGIMWKLG